MVQAITGEGGPKSKAPRWQFVLALAVTIVLAAGAGGAVRWIVTRKAPAYVPRRNLPTAVEEVQNLRLQGNTDEAKKKLDAALADSATSKDIKYMLYIQEGNLETDKSNWSGAITYYLKADQLKETYEITSLLGDTYAQAGDKSNAIIWYKKAIPLIPQQGNPLREDDKSTLEYKIRQLGGQP